MPFEYRAGYEYNYFGFYNILRILEFGRNTSAKRNGDGGLQKITTDAAKEHHLAAQACNAAVKGPGKTALALLRKREGVLLRSLLRLHLSFGEKFCLERDRTGADFFAVRIIVSQGGVLRRPSRAAVTPWWHYHAFGFELRPPDYGILSPGTTIPNR